MENKSNIEIRYVKPEDKAFWFSLDKHLTFVEFERKVRDKQGYVLFSNDRPVAILRYNLFWDNTPFCTLLYVHEQFQNRGFGKALMCFWENEMRALGYDRILVSTRADETAQHFYRSIGYSDCGSLTDEQTTELLLDKHIGDLS